EILVEITAIGRLAELHHKIQVTLCPQLTLRSRAEQLQPLDVVASAQLRQLSMVLCDKGNHQMNSNRGGAETQRKSQEITRHLSVSCGDRCVQLFENPDRKSTRLNSSHQII